MQILRETIRRPIPALSVHGVYTLIAAISMVSREGELSMSIPIKYI